MEDYYNVRDFEYLEMDTDWAYLWLAGKQLEDIVKPEKNTKSPLHEMKTGITTLQTPGLFEVEAQGNAVISLCSKTYILKKHNHNESGIQLKRFEQSHPEGTLSLQPACASNRSD